jgi:hypothetical protein
VHDDLLINLRAGSDLRRAAGQMINMKQHRGVTEAVAPANQEAAHCAIEPLLAAPDPIYVAI